MVGQTPASETQLHRKRDVGVLYQRNTRKHVCFFCPPASGPQPSWRAEFPLPGERFAQCLLRSYVWKEGNKQEQATRKYKLIKMMYLAELENIPFFVSHISDSSLIWLIFLPVCCPPPTPTQPRFIKLIKKKKKRPTYPRGSYKSANWNKMSTSMGVTWPNFWAARTNSSVWKKS